MTFVTLALVSSTAGYANLESRTYTLLCTVHPEVCGSKHGHDMLDAASQA